MVVRRNHLIICCWRCCGGGNSLASGHPSTKVAARERLHINIYSCVERGEGDQDQEPGAIHSLLCTASILVRGGEDNYLLQFHL